MGRNAIPKLGEWRDGRLYSFRAVGTVKKRNEAPPSPEDGRLVVYEVKVGTKGPPEVLGTAYADGFQEVMAAMWADGYARGKRDGMKEKAAEVRRAIGAG